MGTVFRAEAVRDQLGSGEKISKRPVVCAKVLKLSNRLRLGSTGVPRAQNIGIQRVCSHMYRSGFSRDTEPKRGVCVCVCVCVRACVRACVCTHIERERGGRERESFPRWCSGEESACQYRRCKRHGFDFQVRKLPWRRKWQPTPVFLPGELSSSADRRAWWATVYGVTKSQTQFRE